MRPEQYSSASALRRSLEEEQERATQKKIEENQRIAAATSAANERTAAEIEAGRKRTIEAIEANRQLSDAAIRANKEIADRGIQESKQSSKIALWIAIPSLLLTCCSLLFSYWDSKESKAWMESELTELKTTNARLESLNVGYSKTVEFQEKQLQDLKSLIAELKPRVAL